MTGADAIFGRYTVMAAIVPPVTGLRYIADTLGAFRMQFRRMTDRRLRAEFTQFGICRVRIFVTRDRVALKRDSGPLLISGCPSCPAINRGA
jgi:hypothetical protein